MGMRVRVYGLQDGYVDGRKQRENAVDRPAGKWTGKPAAAVKGGAGAGAGKGRASAEAAAAAVVAGTEDG